MVSRALRRLGPALALLGWPLLAQERDASRPTSPSTPPLYENLGSHHFPITTTSPQAQRYFDQGLRLVYAFNHTEAIRAFEAAAALDSTAAMPHWGIALALGPNINWPMDADAERRATEEVRKAQALSAGAGERAYVEALAERYSIPPGEERAARDSAYARAMRELSRRHPDDLDAATLFAEALMDLAPWNYWTTGREPRPWTPEIVATLESVLERNPDHPGACHYYIHAVEASASPERALPCAERLAELMPGAGHIVHMPAHIYMRLGRYELAVEHNAHAASVDEEYFERRSSSGVYPAIYYPHNLHFLSAAAAMEGQSAEAIRAARELSAEVSAETVRATPPLELYNPVLYVTLARFGRWEEILREPPPPADLHYTRGMWHYARALAHAASGRLEEATVEGDSVEAIAQATPPKYVVGLNSAAALLGIASRVVAGELAGERGQTEEAVRLFEEAVHLEEELTYDEPPPWYQPVRQFLGALLLEAGRASHAEAIYREDLRRNPENGWSLHGLVRSLGDQEKDEEAAAVEERFQRAWARADVALTASRF